MNPNNELYKNAKMPDGSKMFKWHNNYWEYWRHVPDENGNYPNDYDQT